MRRIQIELIVRSLAREARGTRSADARIGDAMADRTSRPDRLTLPWRAFSGTIPPAFIQMRVRIDDERGRRQRDAVGHAGVHAMQPLDPFLPGQQRGQGHHPELIISRGQQRRRTATRRPDTAADGRNRATARSPPRAWRRRRRSIRERRSTKAMTKNDRRRAHMHENVGHGSCRSPAPAGRSRPTRMSDTRLEIVMVKRSLEAAKAISAGNSSSRIASATMITCSNQGPGAALRAGGPS